MSQSDSFIDEVTEEVRKDRIFRLIRRYGWIAVLLVLLLVGGAAYNEWRKGQDRVTAEQFGDAVLAALQLDDQASRVAALEGIEAPGPAAKPMLDLLAAAELSETNPREAAQRLISLADNSDAGQIYRQIATIKATALPESGLSVEERRSLLEGLALAQGTVRLLAEEQLALLDIETGQTDAALERLQAITDDAQAPSSLSLRASQMMLILGGTPPDMRDGA